MSTSDADGDPLDCANRYVPHREEDGLPAVDASRSVTMYDAGGIPVANPLNRFVSGGRNPLRYNADGPLELAPDGRGRDQPRQQVGKDAPGHADSREIQCVEKKKQAARTVADRGPPGLWPRRRA